MFYLTFLFIVALIGTGIFAAYHLDRIAVFVIRRANIPVFRVAVGIAIMIVEHPEQWSFDKYHMWHPDIGSIWTGNGAYGVYVETEMGKWQPNFIERRIIREAVDWRISRYLRDRLHVGVEKNLIR